MSKAIVAVVVAAGLTVPFSRVRGNDADISVDAFKGSWECLTIEMTGKPPEKNGDLTFIFAENTIIVMLRDQVGSRGTFTIDASKDPKTIDIVYARGGGTEIQRACGLYKIDGDTLTLITGEGEEEERPKGFACEPGKAHTMVTLKRSPE